MPSALSKFYSISIYAVVVLSLVVCLVFVRKPEPLVVLVPYDNHSSLLQFCAPLPLSWLVENEDCGVVVDISWNSLSLGK